MPVYKCNIDDVDMAYEIGSGGARGRVKEDAAEMRTIANGIMECIQMEEDVGENYPDGKIHILDLKVWMENDDTVHHEFFEKEVLSKQFIYS